MKKTKKFVSILAILLIAILTLTCCLFFACGSDDEEPETTVPGTTDDGTTGGANNDDEDETKATVTVDPKTLTLEEKATREIKATVTMSDETDYDGTYAWASDNETVATVSDSTTNTVTVTAGESGTANITVTAGGQSATCVVTVTYRTMTDSDAAALYEAIKMTCEYDGSYTATGIWTISGTEDQLQSGDEEATITSYDDTDWFTYSYDSESGYFIYKDDWAYVNTDEAENEWEAEYIYLVPEEDGTFTLYEYYTDNESDEPEMVKSTVDDDDIDDYRSNLAVATGLGDDFYGDGEDSWATVDELLEYLFTFDDDVYEASTHVGTSGTNTIYTISVTVYESNMSIYDTEDDEHIEYGIESTYTYEFEFAVNEEGYIYKFTENSTRAMNVLNMDGTYYNYIQVDYMTWEIAYSFDESLKLSEEEMAEYVGED